MEVKGRGVGCLMFHGWVLVLNEVLTGAAATNVKSETNVEIETASLR